MELKYSTFILPHIGDSYSQCADRFAIGKEKKCFAIADGVGESLFPYDWAELVCEDFIAHPELFCVDNKLIREKNLIDAWDKERQKRIENLTDTERFLYEMGLEKADFAACTFVGLCVNNKQWECQAIGDSYLFVLDSEFNIVESIASQEGQEFNNFPEYFASQAEKNHGNVVKAHGSVENVAYFVLLTDAISDWFLKVDKERRRDLLSMVDNEKFASFVNRERTIGNMKDDDTTAVIVEVVHDNSDLITIKEIYNTDIKSLIIKEERNETSTNSVDVCNVTEESEEKDTIVSAQCENESKLEEKIKNTECKIKILEDKLCSIEKELKDLEYEFKRLREEGKHYCFDNISKGFNKMFGGIKMIKKIFNKIIR